MRLYQLLVVLVCSSVWASDSLTIALDFSDASEVYEVPGYPKVPKKTVRVLLPFGTDLLSADFQATRGKVKKIKMQFPITAQPKPLCEDVRWEPELPKFSEDEFFPKDHIGETAVIEKHGYRIAYIEVFPVLYQLNQSQGFSVQEGLLTLKFSKLRGDFLKPRGWVLDEKEALQLSEYSENLSTYPKLRSRMASAEYVVIGPKDYLSDNDPYSIHRLFADKQARGISTRYVTLEDIYLSSGNSKQEKIRNAVKKLYQNEGTRYLLILGNGYTTAPVKSLYAMGYYLPADLYYGCLDGNFSNPPDLACEVAVGRAPVANLTELHTFVRKTIQMQELSAGEAVTKSVLNFGEKMDSQTYASGSL